MAQPFARLCKTADTSTVWRALRTQEASSFLDVAAVATSGTCMCASRGEAAFCATVGARCPKGSSWSAVGSCLDSASGDLGTSLWYSIDAWHWMLHGRLCCGGQGGSWSAVGQHFRSAHSRRSVGTARIHTGTACDVWMCLTAGLLWGAGGQQFG